MDNGDVFRQNKTRRKELVLMTWLLMFKMVNEK